MGAKALLILVTVLILFSATVFAPYISHIPIRTVFNVQIGTGYLEGRYPGLSCVVVSGDVLRDLMLGKNKVDPYSSSVFVEWKPYKLFCGYDGKMIGVGDALGLCYVGGSS